MINFAVHTPHGPSHGGRTSGCVCPASARESASASGCWRPPLPPPTAHACPALAPPRHQRAVRSALPPGACTPSMPRPHAMPPPPSRSPSSPLPPPAPPSQHNIVIAFSHHASHDGLTRRLMPHDIVPVGRVGRSGAGRLGVALAQVLCAAGPVHEDSGDEQSPFHLIFPVSVVCSVCVCLGNRGWLHRS